MLGDHLLPTSAQTAAKHDSADGQKSAAEQKSTAPVSADQSSSASTGADAATRSDSTQAARLRPEIDRIIRSGRRAEIAAGSAWPVFLLSLLSGGLLWLSFAPVEFAPAAWLAPVPLGLFFRMRRLPARSYRAMYAAALLWSLITLQWMRLGHVTMYGALVALSVYVAFYTPVFVAIGRLAVKSGLPVWLAMPLVWTSLEFVRAYVLTGFSWYYLAHSQYRWTTLVQISDVTGAYGVSFLIVLMAGALTCCIPDAWLARLRIGSDPENVRRDSGRSRLVATLVGLSLVAAACGYGMTRLLPVDAAADGPRIAVVQGNFTPELKHDSQKWSRMWTDHYLMSRGIKDQQPSLIVWPETMFPEPNVQIDDDVSDAELAGRLQMPGVVSNRDAADSIIARWREARGLELLEELSIETGAALLIGQLTEVHQKAKQLRYNSASFLQYGEYVGRYDKIHRVIFGEFIPLKDVFPWLTRLTPFGAGFGIDAGTQPEVFLHEDVAYAPVICFEDTVPQLVRRVASARHMSGKPVDVLVNLTNDAWFRGSSELDQHLITSTFRCIETRRPMVRAVNAGVSAYIDSCGRIRQPEHQFVVAEDETGVTGEMTPVDSMRDPATGARWRQKSMVFSSQIPLDGRTSMYLLYGDWFSLLCVLGTVIAVVVGRYRPAKSHNTTGTSDESAARGFQDSVRVSSVGEPG